MDIVTTFKNIGNAISRCEKMVAVLEAQKKELDNELKANGFTSVEELKSAIDGMEEVIEDEQEKIVAKLDELSKRLEDIDID